MTQVLAARAGGITPEMEAVARREGLDVEFIQAGVASGTIVIPRNINRKDFNYCGIGQGLKIKVNTLIGTSSDRDNIEMEARKLAIAEDAGCDAVMDLSTGGDIDGMRHQTLSRATVAVGSVPIYQCAIEAIEKRGSVVAMDPEDMFAAVEKQAAEGVDFMAIHTALNFEVLKRLKNTGRVTDVVSRGGAFLTGWMLHNNKENPLYEQFDRLLEILKRYDVTLSMGDAIRPGATADSLDGAQLQGMIVGGELVARAQAAGVQVMVEGPGHVPMNHVRATMLLQKRLCNGAPYFVLGTLATDVAPGYDHITSAIGGAIAGTAGADFICNVTPAEHLGLPSEQDVKDGIIAARIAAHAADLAKGNKQALATDLRMARARVALDWERQIGLAIDPGKMRANGNGDAAGNGHGNGNGSGNRIVHGDGSGNGNGAHECAVCGPQCAARVAAEYFGIA